MREAIIKMSKKELRRLEVVYKILGKWMKQKDAAEILLLPAKQVKRIV